MPSLAVEQEFIMHYEDEYFGPQWVEPDVILMVHGVAESSLAWSRWIPVLSGRFRVIRMDVRGFGMSTCPTSGHHWSLEGLSHDILALLDGLNVAKAHLVGAKLGGAIAMKFAAGHSDRLLSLAVLSSPVRGVAHTGDPKLLAATSRLATHGVRKWAEDTQRLRLGTEVSEDQIRYWNDFMSSADQNVCVEVDKMAAHMDIIADLPQIKVPTIVFGMEASAFQSSKAIEQWARLIPQCEVVTLMGSGYHPAAIHPVECAHRVLEFIDRKTSFVG